MKIIDVETWKRRKQYEMFKGMELPHFNICANVDVTETRNYLRERNISFFKGMLYLLSKTINEIPELRTRIRGEQVVEHPVVNPSFTVLGEDELFGFARTRHREDFREFYQGVERALEGVKDNITPDFDADMDSDFYLTTLPWVSFTSIQHPMHIAKGDSVPRIAMGRYFQQGKRLMMPLSIQAHHALADGIHAGKFYMKMEKYLSEPERYLKA